jgi:signal transduction histidine kinase
MEGSCPPFEFDRVHLYNAIYNLVYNALAHTKGGTVRIRLGERRRDAVIEVRDTGSGMPPDVLATLFTDQAVSTTPGGTGLGTRIVARVAEIHGGTVEAESRVGEGTRVRLTLPMRRGGPSAADNWSI